MSTRSLFIGICYNPGDEVEAYVRSIQDHVGPNQASIIIADNSPTSGSCLSEVLSKYRNTELLHYPDNPGYYPAANRAFRAKTTDAVLPSWTIVSNTDMKLESPVLDQLSTAFDPSQPLVIAPNIYVAGTGRAQNPFLSQRPSRRWFRVRKTVFSHPLTFKYYRSMARLKRRVIRDEERRVSGTLPIYAPHGSFIIFSRGYFERGGRLNYPLPLYGEEIFVAEVGRAIGANIVYVPDIRIRHDEHIATSKLDYKRVSKAMHAALEMGQRLHSA